MNKKQPAPIETICIIVNRGHSVKVAEILKSCEVEKQVFCLGEGTSKSNMQSLFGFALSERDVVFGIINAKNSKKAFESFEQAFGEEQNICIAFTIPFSSATSTTLDMLGIKY